MTNVDLNLKGNSRTMNKNRQHGGMLGMVRRVALRMVMAIVMLACLPVTHAAEGWGHQRKLNFDTTASGVEIKEPVTQFPLLVRLHSGNFTFAEAKPDGSDLRFFAADGKTPLKYHLENFDATSELANFWVVLPKLSPNLKTESIVVTWGNPKADTAADEPGSYDPAQIFVYHFAQADAVKDSTANGNHPGRYSKTVPTGPIGPAVAFDGSTRIDIPASASLRLSAASGFTFTAWVNASGSAAATLYAQRDGAKTLTIGLAAGTPFVAGGGGRASASSPIAAGGWHHLAVVASGGKVTFYIDGNEAGGAALAITDLAGTASIGDGFQGELDEVTLAATARSASFIKVLAGSQGADTPLMAFADSEAADEGISYVSILLGAVTLDGWIVIGLLIVMAVVSFHVMITKSITLVAINKANAVFIEAFRTKSAELLTPGHEEINTLAEDPRLKKSTIFHLYRGGLQEVQQRFDAQAKAGEKVNLTAAALDSIRATLDAAMVREGQRLNSGIVLLTIAISGGPFLGLLGTVVGVMITFAAIAAAGDVNVNAIAPGIAAALVATVAGLAVAIPALFGYNWLAIQIKNVTADNHVFADEFLTKAAEMHSV